MSKIKVTITDIERDLCDLDTEYRESLANALMKLGYVSDSPLKLSMGTIKQQLELERVYEMPLKSRQLKEIINFISKEMKNDFQYRKFKPIELYYLSISDVIKKQEKIRAR